MGLNALAVGGGVTGPRDARHASGGLLAVQGPTALDVRTGVLSGPGSTALITGTSKTGPKMSVLIGVHVAVTTRGSANGPYLGPTLDAPVEVDVELAPASGSRIDVVYVKQRDTTSGVPSPDATTGPLYATLTGQVSSGTPAKPDLSTIVGAQELGTVTVAAGATSTNGSGVTIANTARQTVARGGVLPVVDPNDRAALTAAGGAYPGLVVAEASTGRLYEYASTSAGWQYIGGAPPPIVAATVNTGWAAVAGHRPTVYKDSSGLVHVLGWVTNSGIYTPNTGSNVPLTLPTGFRPATSIVVGVTVDAAPTTITGTVHTDGTVSLDNNGSVSIPAGRAHFFDSIVFHPGYPGDVLA